MRDELRLTRATLLAFAVLGAGWGSFAALVPDLKAGLAVGDAAFGRMLLASALGLLTAMWVAPRVDRALRARAMPVAVVLLGAAFLGPGMASGPLGFLAAMAALGMASGLTDVVMNVRVAERETATGRSLMSLNHAAFSFAYAAAAALTGLAREAGLPPVAVFSAVAMLAVAAQPWLGQTVAEPAADDGAGRGGALRGTVWAGGAIVLVAFLVENATEVWSALHIERTLGGRAAEGALGPAILGLTMGIGRLGGHLMAARLEERAVMLAGAACAAGGLVVAAAAPGPAVAYAGFAMTGLGVSVVAPMALALIGRASPPALQARAISRAAVIGFSGFFIGPPIIGALSEAFGLRLALACVALTLVVVPLGLAILARRASEAPAPTREAR